MHDEAIIAFLLFCLEILSSRGTTQTKASLNTAGGPFGQSGWQAGTVRFSSSPPATNDLFHGKQRFHIF
jgi:hypothetical protein